MTTAYPSMRNYNTHDAYDAQLRLLKLKVRSLMALKRW